MELHYVNSSFRGSGEVEEGHMQGLGKRQRRDWLARVKRLSYQMVRRRSWILGLKSYTEKLPT